MVLPLRIGMAVLTFIGEVSLLLADAFKRFFRPPIEWSETVNQMSFIGVSSIPIVVLTNFFSGAVLALYSTQFLTRYGASAFVGATVALAVAREIAPVLAGIMVAARCGSSMAAQIGSMAVTEQVDALRMLSVHPTSYLVLPRLIASMTMLPILALLGIYSGIAGGWMVALYVGGVSTETFLESIKSFLRAWDVFGGILKTPFFGLITAIIACQQGLRTTNGAVGVGLATTRTVVISMVLIYVSNYFLASLLFR